MCPSKWFATVFIFKLSVLLTSARDPAMLYTVQNNKIIPLNSPDVEFNPRFGTICIIHGWQESVNIPYYQGITQAYMKRGSYNYILVDWSKIASPILYFNIIPKLPGVARYIANALIQYQYRNQINFSTLTIVGFSLGGQIAGYIGNYLNSFENPSLIAYKIDALDPAGPGFFPLTSIKYSDAKIVSILHTSLFGIQWSAGTRDWWANPPMVTNQPGCNNTNLLPALLTLDFLDTGVGCSHLRAHEIYIESINSDDFIGENCLSNCNPQTGAVYSFNTADTTTGVWTFRTNADPPYGLDE